LPLRSTPSKELVVAAAALAAAAAVAAPMVTTTARFGSATSVRSVMSTSALPCRSTAGSCAAEVVVGTATTTLPRHQHAKHATSHSSEFCAISATPTSWGSVSGRRPMRACNPLANTFTRAQTVL
jgi:hypothetical protein